jgi:hypothetical protein
MLDRPWPMLPWSVLCMTRRPRPKSFFAALWSMSRFDFFGYPFTSQLRPLPVSTAGTSPTGARFGSPPANLKEVAAQAEQRR